MGILYWNSGHGYGACISIDEIKGKCPVLKMNLYNIESDYNGNLNRDKIITLLLMRGL